MPEPDILADDYEDLVRMERELHERGWQPVMMRDELTGQPFTRWFPPTRDAPINPDHIEPLNAENGVEQQ